MANENDDNAANRLSDRLNSVTKQDVTIEDLKTWHLEDSLRDAASAGPSSASGNAPADQSSHQGSSIPKKVRSRCPVCLEDKDTDRLIPLSCVHSYCPECLVDLFERATKDEQLFPPRCCRELIPVSLIYPHASAESLLAFENASVEFTTTDRTYCSSPSCSTFIPPSFIIASQAECPACQTKTCAICKHVAHDDQGCPEDPEILQTMIIAAQNDWKRCVRCGTMIELGVGCYHMTCNCGHEFCYRCGASPYKTCDCPQWPEDNLTEAGRELLAINQRIEQMENHVRLQAGCRHSRHNHPHNFRRFYNRRGRELVVFDCQMCNTHHRSYIMRCRRCWLMICEHCVRNRLRPLEGAPQERGEGGEGGA